MTRWHDDPVADDGSSRPGDALLDALLAQQAVPPLADDGFSAAVLQRVQVLQARRWLPPAEALALARQQQARARRQALFSAVGAGVGALLAAGVLAQGLDASALGLMAPAGLALLVGLAIALALLAQAEA